MIRSEKSNCYRKDALNMQKSVENILCDLKVVTLIVEMPLLLSRSIPIDRCLLSIIFLYNIRYIKAIQNRKKRSIVWLLETEIQKC